MSKILAVSNVEQAILWENEIAGQISDGFWENASPRDHWQVWCDAEVIVDEDNMGREFWARRTMYNLTNPELLAVVSKRMLAYVRIGRAYGREHVHDLHYLLDLDGNYQGIPKWLATGKGGPRDQKLIAKLKAIDPKLFKLTLSDTSYTEKDLKRDLCRLKLAMRTERDPNLNA